MIHCMVNPNNTSVDDFDNYPWDNPISLLVNIIITMTSKGRILSQLNCEHQGIYGGGGEC